MSYVKGPNEVAAEWERRGTLPEWASDFPPPTRTGTFYLFDWQDDTEVFNNCVVQFMDNGGLVIQMIDGSKVVVNRNAYMKGLFAPNEGE